ncbi:Serine/threonine-protein kinase PSK2 [Spathaspora sp. JA1]|nr:Serine/threonine-protein kinase PSK2 [Spathaspora sp. JA1]
MSENTTTFQPQHPHALPRQPQEPSQCQPKLLSNASSVNTGTSATGTRIPSPFRKSTPSFFLYDEDEQPQAQQPLPAHPYTAHTAHGQLPPPPVRNTLVNKRSRPDISSFAPPSLYSPPTTHTSTFNTSVTNNNPGTTTTNSEIEDILKFPIESSHAYSYAHLSPNSLALRLNVLRRSLEILKDRPDLFKSIAPEHISNSDDEMKEEDSDVDMESLQSQNRQVQDDTQPLFKTASHPVYSNRSATHSTSSLVKEKSPEPQLPRRASVFSTDHPHEAALPKKYKIQSNASSAALSAFFRPPIRRAGSLPLVDQEQGDGKKFPLFDDTSSQETGKSTVTHPRSQDEVHPHSYSNSDLKEIVNLLENDLDFLVENSQIGSETLEDLTQEQNVDQNDRKLKLKHDFVKSKLLYALAMPFMETSVRTTSLLESDGTQGSLKQAPIRPSTTALNMLNNNTTNSSPVTSTTTAGSRPFHSLLAGKHSLPQSVFTVEPDMPYSVIAANDLACLMFGVSKSMIKSLTLMDLIAPQFRDFVMGKLTKYLQNSLESPMRRRGRNKGESDVKDILFAGEIIAIAMPGDQNYAWTSLWAKKKGGIIICMFDQILCDAFDVCISSPTEYKDYRIDSVHVIAGNLVEEYGITELPRLEQLSESLNSVLLKTENDDLDEDERDSEDSDYINSTRYFTLQLNTNENIPCAITSNPLEIHPDRLEIRLKIHTMPYIAGIFVISSQNYQILSCNNAIAKNLFGKSFDELKNKSINELVPNFTSILEAGLDQNVDKFQLVPGLVLPEHFFRKYDAMTRCKKDTNSDEEELFLHSNGVPGVHRDGKTVYVDIQLRASSFETLVLWITYSRSSKNRHMLKELDKLSSSTSSISLASSSAAAPSGLTRDSTMNESQFGFKDGKRSSSRGHERTGTTLPSQLMLLKNEAQDILEFSPHIENRSSSRSDKIDTGSPMDLDIPEEETSPAPAVVPIPVPIPVPVPVPVPAPIGNSKIRPIYKVSEEEILRDENQHIEEKLRVSSRWPREVGLIRRTKKFSEFEVIKSMGEGAYGKVVLVRHKADPEYTIIMKCIDKERILVDTWVRDRKLGTIPSEIQIMAYLNSTRHANIMRVIDFFEDEKYYYLETPIFGNPPAIDLFDFIEIKKDISEAECQFIFKQIVSAISHLHSKGIVHRDIKDENVIVDERGVIKLIDFGSAGYVKSGPFDVFVGTIDYASPEVLRGEKYEGRPQDIWALGILLYTMLYKENPFYNVDEIMEGDLRIPYIVSEASLALIRKILVRDIHNRPVIEDIVNDKWLEN